MLVECLNCEAIVDGEVIASYEHFEEAESLNGKYSFLKCPRCEQPFIMLQVDDGVGIHPRGFIHQENRSVLQYHFPLFWLIKRRKPVFGQRLIRLQPSCAERRSEELLKNTRLQFVVLPPLSRR